LPLPTLAAQLHRKCCSIAILYGDWVMVELLLTVLPLFAVSSLLLGTLLSAEVIQTKHWPKFGSAVTSS